jgi:hypothetical protein
MSVTEDHVLGGRSAAPAADGYRAGLDAALLAAACDAGRGERVLDAGCGVGRGAAGGGGAQSQARFVGVERDRRSRSPWRDNIGSTASVSTSLFLVIQGIIARSRAPTSSIGCSASRRRMALKLGWPAAHSSIQSRTKRPDWMSVEDALHLGLGLGVTTRGPLTYSPYSAVLEIE